MKRLIYILFALVLVSSSCSKEDEPIKENPPIENPDGGQGGSDEEPEETPQDSIPDKVETHRVVITAFVDEKFTLPSGTRCAAEFYDADGNLLDCEKMLAAASEHSFYVGAELDKGKEYTCLIWFDNGQYGYDVTNGLKNIGMTTKPSLAFHGKLNFNSETTQYKLEMKPAVAQVVLKLKGHPQTGDGLFSFSEDTPVEYVFDVSAGTVVSTDIAYTPKTVFLLNNIGNVAELYTFVPDGGMDANLKVDCGGKSIAFDNIPLSKGRITTLDCDWATTDFDIKITDMKADDADVEF